MVLETYRVFYLETRNAGSSGVGPRVLFRFGGFYGKKEIVTLGQMFLRARNHDSILGNSDFHNLTGFTSKKKPNNILKNV